MGGGVLTGQVRVISGALFTRAAPTIVIVAAQSSVQGLAPASTAIGFIADERETGRASAKSGARGAETGEKRVSALEGGCVTRAETTSLPRCVTVAEKER